MPSINMGSKIDWKKKTYNKGLGRVLCGLWSPVY